MQKKWMIRAKETYNFHRDKVLEDEKWTTVNTARSMKRSIGSICEDLMIAKWCRSHENQLMKFKYAYEALEFIRTKQKEMPEID